MIGGAKEAYMEPEALVWPKARVEARDRDRVCGHS